MEHVCWKMSITQNQGQSSVLVTVKHRGTHWASLLTMNTGFSRFFILAFVLLINFDKPWKMTIIASIPVELSMKYTKEKKGIMMFVCLWPLKTGNGAGKHFRNPHFRITYRAFYKPHMQSHWKIKDLQESWSSPFVWICEFIIIKWFLY